MSTRISNADASAPMVPNGAVRSTEAFFFQAEDGIRDLTVTGVQTCALPIAIMGPNGSGKSTLAQVLAGHPAYVVTAGQVLYEGNDLLAMAPEARARAGVFFAFQYPVVIRGLTNAYFLSGAVNPIGKHRGE